MTSFTARNAAHPIVVSESAEIERIFRLIARNQLALSFEGEGKTGSSKLGEYTKQSFSIEEGRIGPTGSIAALSVKIDETRHFFSSTIEWEREGETRLSRPLVVYKTDRRDRKRILSHRWAQVALPGESRLPARVVDESGSGRGLLIPTGPTPRNFDALKISEDLHRINENWAIVQNSSPVSSSWQRVGLRLVPSPTPKSVASVLRSTRTSSATGPSAFSGTPKYVSFLDHRGEQIVAILDQSGPSSGATAIVIPPAWGKTKETLAPLAATLIETFSEASLPLTVLRMDGIRRRGESHTDQECRRPEDANLHYTFTQGATDVLAATRFLKKSLNSAAVLVVSFSVASIESRRALAIGFPQSVDGWISVVGATDPQSLIRAVTGGRDFLANAEEGISSGVQSIQGVSLDVDRAGLQAIGTKIGFFEDALRDFNRISCPITWIAGTGDAWTEEPRIREMLAFGNNGDRKIVRNPTGHQLRTSQSALETFAAIASEASDMCGTGVVSTPVLPEQSAIRSRIKIERARIKSIKRSPNLREFWKNYLLGRDSSLGIELVSETSAYRQLAEAQIEFLDLTEDPLTIADLGCGVSRFLDEANTARFRDDPHCVIGFDIVPQALRRRDERSTNRPRSVVADLNCTTSNDTSIPVADQSINRALASLLFNYVAEPNQLAREIFRILKPSGVVVISVLKPDADTSKICVDGVTELRSGRGLKAFGREGERDMNSALPGFIDDAAKLLELEEVGIFRFWPKSRIRDALISAGFRDVLFEDAFGEPPQAWVIKGHR